VLIVLSPLLAYASERTEEVLTGSSHPFRPGRFLKDTLRGIAMALRNGLLELGINIAVWLATLFLPLAAVIAVPLLWIVSAWFYGFSMFDYLFERRRLGIGASARTARSRAGLVLGNGIAFSLLMKVPFVGIVFAPLMAAIGAVLAWHEQEGTRRPILA
jgi:CysZ protein